MGPLALACLCGIGLAACAVSGPSVQIESNGANARQAVENVTPGAASADQAAGSNTKRIREPLKVGLILPLSPPGQTAVLAELMKKAAELAVTEHDATHIQLIVKDDKSSPEGAKAAADELANTGSEVILGPLFSKSVAAVAPVARQANIPVLAFSTDRQVAGQGTHLLSFLVGPEVHRIVSYASARGKKRFAALIPDDPLGKLTEASFRDAVAKSGGTLTALENYPPQPNGMVEPVQRLRDAMRGIEEHGDPIDALFVPGGEDVLFSLAPLLKKEGIDPAKIKIIGTGGLDYANAGRDPLLVGAWFAGPDPQRLEGILGKVRQSLWPRAAAHRLPRLRCNEPFDCALGRHKG